MSKTTQADSFLSDLLDPESDLAKEIAESKEEPEDPSIQFIVYMVGDKPDCVWQYNHKPDDGIPYGQLYGYWDKMEDGSRKFIEHTSNNLKVMPFSKFMDNIVPDKGCTKIFDSEEDFLIDLL